jgi:hypothetical protein
MRFTMGRRRIVVAALGLIAMTGIAHAQEGYGTVTFTVEVSGIHNVPTDEGGFRNTRKSRIFRGEARLKYAGRGFAAPPMSGYDKKSFEREKDACEQKSSDEEDIAACQDEVQERQNAAERAAMQHINPVNAAIHTPRVDVWANDRCTGELEVADKGTFRRRGMYETGMREVPTSVTGKRHVATDAAGSDGCSFSLTYDPTTQTAEINIDPGPLLIEVVERTNESTAKTHINPFDWTSLRKFEKGNIKVGGTRTGHSGAWNESMGEPVALAGQHRVSGEVVQTATRITWHFTGQPSPPKPKVINVEQETRDNVPPSRGPGSDDPLAGCLKEQEQSGRAEPDPVALMECVQKKARTG